MPRYCDTSRCPDCAAALPAAPGRCPSCGLPLTGPLAGELLRVLRRADDLVVELRHSVAATAVTTTAAVAVAPVSPVGPVGPGASRTTPEGEAPFVYPPPTGPGVTAAPAARRTGLQAPSVPRILLGLGATCLLVAAIIFLAVAWSAIGVGGRTAVLVAATLATGALGVRLGRRGLRIGAESLTAVSLGLLVLDLVGAQHAGWLGELEGSGFVVLLGGAIALAGAGLLAALERDQRRLVVPQVAVVLGILLISAAVHDLTDLVTVVLVVEVLVGAAIVRGTLGHGVPVVAAGAGVLATMWWVVLGGYGLVEALAIDAGTDASVTLRSLWAEGGGLALLATVLLALVPIAVAPSRRLVVQVSLAVSALVATPTLLLATLDNGPTAAAAAWLVALVGWTVTVHVVRRRVSLLVVPATAALALAALVVVTVVTEMLGQAAAGLAGAGSPFTESAGARLAVVDARFEPWLLLPSVVALLAAAWVALPWRRHVAEVCSLVVGLASLATLMQYAVPLWLVVALLVGLAAAALADGVRRPGAVGDVEVAAAAGLLGAAALVALPSAGLTAGVLGAVLVASSVLLLLGRALSNGQLAGLRVSQPVVHVAGALLPLTWGALVWTTADAADLRTAWCGAVVIVVAGLLAIALPRVEVEVAATVAAVLSAPAAIAAADDFSVSLALHLTLAGALVTATSLVHRDRRLLAVPGGLLLASATWVRLADIGVTAPEAYTLPLGLVLLAVGLDRIRRDHAASTQASLLPGLVLSTVPSLLWALGDPVSLRALLLGVACLALAVGGAQLRWSAPLLVGAIAGAVLVVREVAPYAAETPQWVAIGLAGTLLTVVGVTWEKRLQDLQQAGGFLARLR